MLGLSGTLVSGFGSTPEPALAEVVHGSGYNATVLGWTSWYGNYGLGAVGWGWCIDHGIAAPDAAYGYVATDITDAGPRTKAAMSWAASTNLYADRVGAAATMLVLHDLMGAQYPFGRLNVDGLTAAHLDGFAGAESAVLERARTIKADALAHADVVGPLILRLEATPVRSGELGLFRATLTDANGRPIPDAVIEVASSGAVLPGPYMRTGTDGTDQAWFRGGEGRNSFTATASAIDPQVHVFAPTSARAQRIAQPGFVRVPGAVDFEAVPPTTTTAPSTTLPATTLPPTTTTPPTTQPPTTLPSTTTTRLPTTTTPPTTQPPTTLPPTTLAPTTLPPTTLAPTTLPPTTRPPTTTAPPTTRAVPETTTTRLATTTLPPTTLPPTTLPPTTLPSTTAPSGSLPPTTMTESLPPPAPPPPAGPPRQSTPPSQGAPPSTGMLPRTGAQVRGLLMCATGLILLGTALLAVERERRRRQDPFAEGR